MRGTAVGARVASFICAALVAVTLISATASSAKDQAASPPDPMANLFGGPFSLIDHHGTRVSERDFAGRHMLIYFGYTHCPDICPTDLTNIAAALDTLGADLARIQPLFITLDPDRDTVAVMAAHSAAFHPALLGLTGSADEIAAASSAWRVHHKRFRLEGMEPDEYFVDHSSLIYLMGPGGEFVTLIPHGTSPDRIAAILRKYLGS